MELQFNIRPGVSPIDRGELEDLVVEALGSGAECLGGGGMLDGSAADFVIEVEGLHVEDVLERCREAFAQISFSLPTTVELDLDGETYAIPTKVTGGPTKVTAGGPPEGDVN
jgi:hypothetical protein